MLVERVRLIRDDYAVDCRATTLDGIKFRPVAYIGPCLKSAFGKSPQLGTNIPTYVSGASGRESLAACWLRAFGVLRLTRPKTWVKAIGVNRVLPIPPGVVVEKERQFSVAEGENGICSS